MLPTKWFAFWSDRKPDDASPRIALAGLSSDFEMRIVAVRAALRAYPGVSGIGAGVWRLGAECQLPICLHSLRGIFVGWCSIAFDGVRDTALDEAFAALAQPLGRLDAGMPDFYNQNIMSSDYAVSAWQDNTEAARRAVALVEAIQTLTFADLPFDAGRTYADFLDTMRLSGPSGHSEQAQWRGAQRQGIGADCMVLREGWMTPRELALAPLWPEPRSAALETNLAFGSRFGIAKQMGSNLSRWIAERKDGILVFNLDPDKARERAVRTANLPAEFWTGRDAADVLYGFDYCLHGELDNPTWGRADQKNPMSSLRQG